MVTIKCRRVWVLGTVVLLVSVVTWCHTAGGLAVPDQQNHPTTQPAATHPAGPEDVAVEIIRITSPTKVVVTAMLRNKADVPVKVYIPGFCGPIAQSSKGGAAVQLIRAPMGEAAYLVLFPNESFGRRMELSEDEGVMWHATYTIYREGKESEGVQAVIHSDGQISRPKRDNAE